VQPEQTPSQLVERFSIWKTVGLELLLIGMAVLPLSPGFGDRLRYSAMLYRWPGFALVIASCALLGVCFILILPLVGRALLKLPALVITADEIATFGAVKRAIRIQNIARIDASRFGSVPIYPHQGQLMMVPVFLYRNPERVLEQLRTLQAPPTSARFEGH
jgi:hypothetical protein